MPMASSCSFTTDIARTEVQAYAHDVWMPAELKKANPELEGAALVAEVEKVWGRADHRSQLARAA